MNFQISFAIVFAISATSVALQGNTRLIHNEPIDTEEPVEGPQEPTPPMTCYETAEFVMENDMINGAIGMRNACWEGVNFDDLFKNITVDITQIPIVSLRGPLNIEKIRASAQEYNGTLSMSAPGFTLGDVWGFGYLFGGFDNCSINNIDATLRMDFAEDRCWIEYIRFDQPQWKAMVFGATGLFINGHERSLEDWQAFADALIFILDVFWDFMSVFLFDALKSFGNDALGGFTIAELIEIILSASK